MIDTLAPMHEAVEKGAETLYEKEFVAEFGQQLQDAKQLCQKYRLDRERNVREDILESYINEAWVIYTEVFQKIQRHQQGMQDLHLKHISKGLNDA